MNNEFGFLIVGKAGSGKDAITNYLVKEYGFKQYAFADKMKDILCEHYNLVNPKKTDLIKFRDNNKITYRELLIKYGQTIKAIDKYWHIDNLINMIRKDGINFIISDCRFKMEYITILNEFPKTITIGIDINEKIRKQRLILRDGNVDMDVINENEKEIDDIECNFIIDNNDGLYDTYKQIEDILDIIYR